MKNDMISYIKGKILYKNVDRLVILNNDLGYQIFVSEKRLDKLNFGETVELFTHEYLREDSRELYGFENAAELDFFLQLISISGVGPKLAMKIFNLGSIDKIKKAIDEENALLLSTVPGVGKKTAQKIILELRGKLAMSFSLQPEEREVAEALENLGYNASRVRELIKNLPESANTTEEKIRAVLKILGQNKTVKNV